MMMAMMREEEKHDNNTITDGGSTDPSTADTTPNTRPFKNVSLPFIRVIPRNVWRAKR